MNNKIKVGILGKGTQEVSVESAQTIGDLRDMLALDTDVQAVSGDGKVLTDRTKVSDISGNSVNFVPNVQGGI